MINLKNSINDKIEKYLKKLKKSGLSDKSIETYKNLLKHFELWFEDYDLLSENNLSLMEADI
ncbi:MAG: integrase/recombinase, partial [Persephonella sp.]